MGKPFFSVIVPMHNSEQFMHKCLGSIKAQTFTDYELIVVCDACEDNTASIARDYADKVFEINAHRCGLARNKGLDEAQGQWILFADDDDWWVHEFAFEMIADKLQGLNADVLSFGFMARDFQRKGLEQYYNTPRRNWPAIWCRAWRRDFVGAHRFPDWRSNDDYGFTNELLPLGKSEYWTEALYYYNYMRPGSLSWRQEQGELPKLGR